MSEQWRIQTIYFTVCSLFVTLNSLFFIALYLESETVLKFYNLEAQHIKEDHYRSAIETSFEWRFVGWPIDTRKCVPSW